MESIWEVAKNMELEGEAFYMQLAEDTPIQELKGVFHFLADQEKEHYELFNFLQEGKTATVGQIISAFETAKEAFAKIAPDFDDPEALKSAESSYQKAAETEKGAVEYYTSLLEKAEGDDQKKIIETIISEEKKHQAIMESLVEFVSSPNKWLENAEFNHLEDY